MQPRRRLLAGILAALLAFAGLACETEDFEGDPLQDDAPVEDGDGAAGDDGGY